jgi:uncharacterized protein (DUF2267 family)
MSTRTHPGERVTVDTANRWLQELREATGWHDRERAYLALERVLHALRDSMPAEEALVVCARLPPLVRSVFYLGWRLSSAPGRNGTRSGFLERLRAAYAEEADADPEAIALNVFRVLRRHMTLAGAAAFATALPIELRDFCRD